MWVAKVTYGDTIRRFRFDEPASFQTLSEQVMTMFELSPSEIQRAQLRYTDPDGDHVCMSSDAELAEALALLNNVPHPILIMTLKIAAERPPVAAASSWAQSLGGDSSPALSLDASDDSDVVLVGKDDSPCGSDKLALKQAEMDEALKCAARAADEKLRKAQEEDEDKAKALILEEQRLAEVRLAEEARKAEEEAQRIEMEKRLADEKAKADEEARRAEEARLAEEARAAKEARLVEGKQELAFFIRKQLTKFNHATFQTRAGFLLEPHSILMSAHLMFIPSCAHLLPLLCTITHSQWCFLARHMEKNGGCSARAGFRIFDLVVIVKGHCLVKTLCNNAHECGKHAVPSAQNARNGFESQIFFHVCLLAPGACAHDALVHVMNHENLIPGR